MRSVNLSKAKKLSFHWPSMALRTRKSIRQSRSQVRCFVRDQTVWRRIRRKIIPWNLSWRPSDRNHHIARSENKNFGKRHHAKSRHLRSRAQENHLWLRELVERNRQHRRFPGNIRRRHRKYLVRQTAETV